MIAYRHRFPPYVNAAPSYGPGTVVGIDASGIHDALIESARLRKRNKRAMIRFLFLFSSLLFSSLLFSFFPLSELIYDSLI